MKIIPHQKRHYPSGILIDSNLSRLFRTKLETQISSGNYSRLTRDDETRISSRNYLFQNDMSPEKTIDLVEEVDPPVGNPPATADGGPIEQPLGGC